LYGKGKGFEEILKNKICSQINMVDVVDEKLLLSSINPLKS
jgi:hypothetical protein